MIHMIARNCAKNFGFVKASNPKGLISLQRMYFSTILNSNTFKFSTETQTPQKTSKKPKYEREARESISPIDYYRNTIRKVNIRANGRGSFSSYKLQKIVNMSVNEEHAKVMFEAYFNYLGHFTIIPSNIVDSLVIKALQIGNQTEQLLDIFSHHCYLTYFPHYRATKKFIKNLSESKDYESLEKLIRTIIRSPLLKINNTIVDTLLKASEAEDCPATTKEYILKVLIMRRNLTEGINREDLIAKVCAALEKGEFGPFEAKPMILEQLRELTSSQSSSVEETVNRLILTSTFGLIDDCGRILAKEGQEIGTQYERFFDYVTKLYPRSSQEVNYGQALKVSLSEAKLSLEVAQKLQKLASGTTE